MSACRGRIHQVTFTRLVLFLGLAFHKLVWEFMKRAQPGSRPARVRPSSRWVRVVKAGKLTVLALLVVQTLFLDLFPINRRPGTMRVLGMVLYFLGLGTAVAGRLHLGKHWVDLEDSRVIQGKSLVTAGVYRYLRHPIYGGDILLLTGLELALNSWLVLAVSVPLAVVTRQVAKEEAMLSQAFPGYREYRARTRRFIPFVL